MATRNGTSLKAQLEEELIILHDMYVEEMNFDLKSFINALIILSLLLTLLFVYFCYIRTLNWTKDLCDVGYDCMWEKKTWPSKSYKKVIVEQVKRLRKVGELPPVYPNGWFALLESSEVKTCQVKYVSALGEHFAVFRTENNEIKILDAYCPHIGANMAIGGKVHGNCLECPFHGWKFNGDSGECVDIPYTTCKIPKSAKVKTWHAHELNDYIFVWYHAEGAEPSWRIHETPEIKSGQWKYRGRNEFLVCAHIQEIPENGADIAHLNVIHEHSVLGGTDIRFYNKSWLSFLKHNFSSNWNASEEPDTKHVAHIKLKHEMSLFKKFHFISMDVNIVQVGPGYVEMAMNTAFGRLLIAQVVTPVEPLLQRMIHRIYCHPLLAPFASMILIGESIMVERDIMVWNHKQFIKKPLLMKEDYIIKLFRKWFSQFYSTNSPTFKYQVDDMDW